VYEQAADGQPAPLPVAALEPVAFSAPEPSPARARVSALLEVMLCSGYPTQLSLVLLMTSMGMSIRTSTGGLTPSFIFILSLVDAVLVVSLVCFFIKAHGESVRQVLTGDRPIVREVLVGLVLVPAVFVVVVVVLGLVLSLAPKLHNVPLNPLAAMVQTTRDAIIFSVVVMVAGGVREEVQRGFIVHRFDQHLGGSAFGVAAYSVAFGLGHVEQGWDAALATGMLGAIWGCIYVARRSIVAPMVSHAGFNLLQLIKFVSLR
jgi:membrane protease YdiL (CAAX protease family)